MKNTHSKIQIIFWIGIGLLLIGILCLMGKALSPESIDASGILHEAFFLLPLGFGALFTGIIILIGSGIALLLSKKR